MGGDHAPALALEGAVAAVREAAGDVQIALVGPESRLQEALAGLDVEGLPLQIVDAPEVIGMDESPAVAVKQKRRSSIHVGLGAHKQGLVDAFVSAGNTGAVMAASLFILGRLPGVARPSIFGYFPTPKSFSITLDVGANVDCKPEHLVQFAKMGAIYAERVLKREQPVVGLLNVGEEPGKGNDAVKAAFGLLQEDESLNFIGNIEGRDVLLQAADVIVCDGFVGNILLKFGESLTTALRQMIVDEMAALGLSPDEQRLMGRVMANVQKRFNYEEYGGVPLLGVDGNVMIGHGGSTARAFKQMILSAAVMVKQDIPGSIASALQP